MEQLALKLLYVDALNFSNDFAFVNRTWSLKKPVKAITEFVAAATAANYQLKIFIDAGIDSEEAIAKWKLRREEEVRGEYKDVPHGLSSLMGDIFRSLGVEVFYSPLDADNDDCLASYATADGADILSNDRDFFRYTNAKYKLYGSFTILDGRLKLKMKDVPKPNPRFPEPPPRASLNPLPKMLTHNPAFNAVVKLGLYRRGAPSPLVKQTGNPHAKLTELRASLYLKLGRKEDVIETWPEWDDRTETVVWEKSSVTPSHEGDALFSRSLPRLLELLFGDRQNALDIEVWEWSNHLFAERALLYEIYAAYHDNTKTVLELFGDYDAPVQDDSPVEHPCTNWFKEGHCKFGNKCFAKNGHHDCHDSKSGRCRRKQFCRFRHP